MNDIELIRAFRQSPLFWIERTFKLTPQPLLPNVKADLPADEYGPEHFAPFEKGKHLTWQQWLIFRAIEYAIEGKGSRWISVSSGHGIGKSSTMALLMLWFLFCHKDAQIPCTAPTADQMYDVLWKEVKLWIHRMPKWMADLYDHQNSYIRMVERPETWFARAKTAKKENAEALAGVHGEHILMLIDESSGVHEDIFTTAEGALTNKNIFVVMISNPTRLSGYFFNSHHKDRHNWQTLRFSCRESPIVDAQYVNRMVEKYGEGSPQVMVRVDGIFPTSEEDQFIATDLFDQAAIRHFERDLTRPRILSLDAAWFGDDACALSDRQGNLARFIKERRGQDTMATVGDVVHEVRDAEIEGNPYDFITIDVIGIGAGIYDRCKELQRQGDLPKEIKIVAVNVAEKPYDDTEFVNSRAELWQLYKDWLKTASVDPKFKDDSCAIKYKFDSRGRLQMEKKEDMKSRGLSSPDRADSLIISFAVRATRREDIPLQQPKQHKRKMPRIHR